MWLHARHSCRVSSVRVIVITKAYLPIGSTKSPLLDTRGLLSEGDAAWPAANRPNPAERECVCSHQSAAAAFQRASSCRASALISPAGAALLCDLRCFHYRLYAFSLPELLYLIACRAVAFLASWLARSSGAFLFPLLLLRRLARAVSPQSVGSSDRYWRLRYARACRIAGRVRVVFLPTLVCDSVVTSHFLQHL